MRWILGTLVALLVATIIYVGSAVAALTGLVEAARSGDTAAIISRTDTAGLRRSLVDQVVAAYLKRRDQERPIKPLERLVVSTYGASVADALVGKLLTPENVANMLKNGAVTTGDGTQVNMLGRLTDLDTTRITQTLGRFSIVKPVEFQVRLGDAADAGAVSLHFQGDTWKLSGVQLPASALEQLAQQLPTR
jgi:hypothetical protein